MKKYITPEMNLNRFEQDDIITVSGDSLSGFSDWKANNNASSDDIELGTMQRITSYDLW